MSAESSAAIIQRMADADNAASMRRLERDLREACALLASARQWCGIAAARAGADGPAAMEAMEAIDAFLRRHNAPASWGGRGTA